MHKTNPNKNKTTARKFQISKKAIKVLTEADLSGVQGGGISFRVSDWCHPDPSVSFGGG